MNNIYVDGELPKCCLVCKLECPEEQRCVDGFTMDCDYCSVNERPATCPLKPLSDRLSEERKRVCDELRETIFEYLKVHSMEDLQNLSLLASTLTYDVITDKLDQIERGKL